MNDPIVHAIASDVGEMCLLGICWDSACDGPYGQAAQMGRENLDITSMTVGVLRDICTADWDPVFDAIAETVIASTQVPCAFQFPETPEGSGVSLEFIEVQFQGLSGLEQVTQVANAAACGNEAVGMLITHQHQAHFTFARIMWQRGRDHKLSLVVESPRATLSVGVWINISSSLPRIFG